MLLNERRLVLGLMDRFDAEQNNQQGIKTLYDKVLAKPYPLKRPQAQFNFVPTLTQTPI